MEHRNLLGEPPATYLLPDTEADAAVAAGEAPEKIAARFPAYSAAWASLAERAFAQGDPVTAYAYARTGYHRGLDQLRRAGWKGHGPVPWEHEPNRGFLRCLAALGKAAAAIDEKDEAERCATFLRDSSPTAAEAAAEAALPLSARSGDHLTHGQRIASRVPAEAGAGPPHGSLDGSAQRPGCWLQSPSLPKRWDSSPTPRGPS